MSRETREKKLREVWRYYLTRGHKWTREGVAKKLDVRVEDVQRLIDEAGPSKVLQVTTFGKGCCGQWRPRVYEGQLPPVRKI